jgi:hemolysin activation/secretion protein
MNTFRRAVAALIFACTAMAPMTAHGQSGAIIDQNRADRLAPAVVQPARPGPRAQTPQSSGPQVEAGGSGAAVALRDVQVTGSSLATARLTEAVRPFAGKPLTQANIAAVAEAVNALYQHSDIALYTIQAPQQDLSGGVLRLQVIEGFVQQVALYGEVKSRQLERAKAYAAPMSKEKPLRRSTLERYLSLMRDTSGLKVEAKFLKGSEPGGVILGIGIDALKTDFALSFSNRGANVLGGNQVQADFTIYSLLRPGDATKLTFATPTDPKLFQYYAITESQPIGDNGLLATGAFGYLRTHPKGLAPGDAEIGSLLLSYPVIRSYDQNLYVTGSVDGIDSRNAVVGALIATERTRAVRGSTAYTLTKPTFALQASAAVSHGVTTLGSAAEGAADGSFNKLNGRLAYDHAIGPVFVIRTKAVGQFTGNRLPASELISLGGDDIGRAFAASTVFGDEGAGGSVELAYRPAKGPPSLAGSEVYSFVDGGAVTLHSRFGLPSARAGLASAGLGVRVAYKQKVVVGVEGAYGLDAPVKVERGWKLGLNLRVVH